MTLWIDFVIGISQVSGMQGQGYFRICSSFSGSYRHVDGQIPVLKEDLGAHYVHSTEVRASCDFSYKVDWVTLFQVQGL